MSRVRGWREVDAREYKVIVDPRALAKSTAQVERELRRFGRRCEIEVTGSFSLKVSRSIVFFDTAHHACYRAGTILRQRRNASSVELTLKAMSPDRFIAAG